MPLAAACQPASQPAWVECLNISFSYNLRVSAFFFIYFFVIALMHMQQSKCRIYILYMCITMDSIDTQMTAKKERRKERVNGRK